MNKRKVLYGAVFVVLLAISFLAGYAFNLHQAAKEPSTARRILYYVDPMNPANTSHEPGIAPCGMKMEPVYADEESPGQAATGIPGSMPPGTVKITAEKQQIIGVRTGMAEKGAVNHTIRTVGRVAADEKRVYRLVAGTDGWIRETYNNDTGTLVKKDERLASFYSPQFRAAQLAYISLLSSPDDRSHVGRQQALAPSQQASLSLQTYIDALESLGMSERQINEIGKTKQLADRVFILAPVTGFILARNVSPGQRFDKGAEWYRIADLSRVWVLADLFRNEAEYVKSGTTVKVTIPQQKKEFHAVVSKVLPQFDANSRTLKVRLELDNPGYILRPDMFVDVEFPTRFLSVLTVPSDAVLDSGLRKTVFVDRGGGFFEPRQVETGRRFGDSVEITKGLMPREQIVISGNFLIDSESRMKMAAAGIKGKVDGQQVKDPVCGMAVDPKNAKGAGLFVEHAGKAYYFCMPECKKDFLKNPGGYVEEKAEDQRSRRDKGATPVTKKTPVQQPSMQGHSMESPGKPTSRETANTPEPVHNAPGNRCP